METTSDVQFQGEQDLRGTHGVPLLGGAHAEHGPFMPGLEPDSEYHYRVQGTAADGTLYVNEDMTFLHAGPRPGTGGESVVGGSGRAHCRRQQQFSAFGTLLNQ